MELIALATSKTLLDAVAASIGNSTAVALPAQATQLTWQTSFGSAPASITIQLQTSNDNATWSTIDTSTSTTAESRSVSTSALFLRGRINAASGGSGVTVTVVPKALATLSTGGISGSTISTDILFNYSGLVSGDSRFTFDPTGASKFVAGTSSPATVLTNFEGIGSDPLSYINQLNATVTSRGSGSVNYGDFNTATAIFATIAPDGADPDYNVYTASIVEALTPSSSTNTMSEIYGQIVDNIYDGGYATAQIEGLLATVLNTSAAGNVTAIDGSAYAKASANNLTGGNFAATVGVGIAVPNVYGMYNTSVIRTGGTTSNVYQSYLNHFVQTASTNWYGYYCTSLAGVGTNTYYQWYDSQGVYRIKEDATFNSVAQAIPALYNPQFTKYVSGTTNYERIVEQWESNVATIRTENSGSGTLRDINLAGAHIRHNGSIGISTTITTGTLVGKTITFVDGIVTAFA